MECKSLNTLCHLRRVTEATGKYSNHEATRFRLTTGPFSDKDNGPIRLTIGWPAGGKWELNVSRLPLPGTNTHVAHTLPDKDRDSVFYAIRVEGDTAVLYPLEDEKSCLVMTSLLAE